MFIFAAFCFCYSIAGNVWIYDLVSPDGLLYFVPSWVNRVKGEGLRMRIEQVVLDCPKCASGQFALWGFMFTEFAFTHWHFLGVFVTIFLNKLISRLWLKYLS